MIHRLRQGNQSGIVSQTRARFFREAQLRELAVHGNGSDSRVRRAIASARGAPDPGDARERDIERPTSVIERVFVRRDGRERASVGEARARRLGDRA